MAQAAPNLHTRRGFSKWLAVAGAAIIAPIPTTANAQAQAEVQPELIDAAALIEAACDEARLIENCLSFAERAMARWKAKNPMPDGSDRKYDNVPEYWKLLSRDKSEWHTRHMIALRNSGKGKAGAALIVANEKLDAARDAFLEIDPRSMADLLFMARMARRCDDDRGTIAFVVTDNLPKLVAGWSELSNG